MSYPAPGDVIGGKYRVDATIGEGGFGIVYRASTLGSGRAVAIKLLKRQGGAKGATTTARFRREMQAIATLEAPETLTLFDFGETDDGLLFMVTEFVEGEDLADVVERKGVLSQGEGLHVLLQVLYSLREAHSRGLVHRDIKPRNIRVYRLDDDPLRVKVLDFGIAKSTNPESPKVTKTGHLVGTPRYMAPEQFLSEQLTPQTDIYALGLVTAEMLGGRDIVDRAGPNPLQRRVWLRPEDGLDPAVADLVNRMTAPDLTERFRSVEEVIAQVRPLRRGFRRAPKPPRPVVAPTQAPAPETVSEQLPTAPPASRVPIIVGLLAAVVVVGAVAVMLKRSKEAEVSTPRVVTLAQAPPPIAGRGRKAAAALEKGVQAYESSRWLEALTHFHSVLRDTPDSPEAEQLRSGRLVDSAIEAIFISDNDAELSRALQLFADRRPLAVQMFGERAAVAMLQSSRRQAARFVEFRVPNLVGGSGATNQLERSPEAMGATLRRSGLDACYDGQTDAVEARIFVLPSGTVNFPKVLTDWVPPEVSSCVEERLAKIRFRSIPTAAGSSRILTVDGTKYAAPWGTAEWVVRVW